MVLAFIDLVKALFHKTTKVPEKEVKRIVALYSEGNISLQNGLYITESDIIKEKKKIKKLKFR